MRALLRYHLLVTGISGIIIFSSCFRTTVKIQNGNLKLEYDDLMHSKVTNLNPGSKSLMSNFNPSDYLVSGQGYIQDFKIKSVHSRETDSELGRVVRYTITGVFSQMKTQIEKILEITVPRDIPDVALFKIKYINKGGKAIKIVKWINNAYQISSCNDNPHFWSFQGSSSSAREDWVVPVNQGYYKNNFLGMNDSDYGGGIPLLDLWRKDAGIAIGHAELVPRLVSLPVSMEDDALSADIGIEYVYNKPFQFKTGDSIETYTTVAMVHQGDYFSSLRKYSTIMQKKGIPMSPSTDDAFEPVWCAWGYMRKFTIAEVLGTLPKVKELGIKWVDIDDGYQISEGDWDVDRTRFPEGNQTMKKLCDKIHAYGMKAKLWWSPLAADPCSDLLKKDPKLTLLNEEGVPSYITWWDSYTMSPAYQGTLDHSKEMVTKFMKEWGFDGLKMDGQHLNCVSPDYNPAHHLDYPEQSGERLPDFFKTIRQTAQGINPKAIIQNCPCGDAMSFYNIPYMNQAVASDPKNSRQIRQKGKTYKAINPGLAYYGDHIELSDGGNDFATQIGIGAVPGTKFTWPKDNPFCTEGSFVLTPEKEKTWKKWLGLYREKMLSKGDYLGNLYDIGYDIPEAHVVKKNDTLFYAFYYPQWNGNIELRGLSGGTYKVYDYVNKKDLGLVTGRNPKLNARFNNNMLIEVYPENKK